MEWDPYWCVHDDLSQAKEKELDKYESMNQDKWQNRYSVNWQWSMGLESHEFWSAKI